MENLVMSGRLGSYYKGKKVFVTGHTGFKGAWLTAWLQLLGAMVKGYALAPAYENSLFDLMKPMPPIQPAESIIADIRDKGRLLEELISFQPDYIFHLAAQPLVRRSYEIPAETFEVNVSGTANLLEAIIQLQHKCSVLVITTDKVYENKEQDFLYRETDPLGGYDPYSSSKACTEFVVNSFRKSFFNPASYGKHGKAIATARAGNVIGGGDWNTDRIIPDIIRALLKQEEIEVRNPAAVRPWQHVLEPIGGYLLLGAHLHDHPANYSGAYNFGPLPEDHLSVRELVETAITLWGTGGWKDISVKSAPHEAGMLKLDIGKAMEELHWKPRLNATQAISWTLQWYQQTPESRAGYTLEQIKAYISL